jgi:hypothetical protein
MQLLMQTYSKVSLKSSLGPTEIYRNVQDSATSMRYYHTEHFFNCMFWKSYGNKLFTILCYNFPGPSYYR